VVVTVGYHLRVVRRKQHGQRLALAFEWSGVEWRRWGRWSRAKSGGVGLRMMNH